MSAAESLFGEGDWVQVRHDVPGGNPRTPHYLRGWTGVIVARYGIVANPLDHQTPYPPLYSVVFTLPDDPRDEVLADLHEEWLRRPE